MKEAKRNENIDALKFLLILAIYIGHYAEHAGKLYPFVFTYHIQLFFVVSGFWILDRKNKPLMEYITEALKRYICPWLIWVFVYVITKSIQREYEISEVCKIFLRYFQSVKGSGVGGIWFIPCFFFVSIGYQMISKAMSWIRGGKVLHAALLLIFSYLLRLLCVSWLPEEDLMFSLNKVPEYLLFYSLGSFLWQVYCCFLEKSSGHPQRCRAVCGIASCVAIVYMTAVYFEKHHLLWSWMDHGATAVLQFVPEIVLAIFALIMNCNIARFVSCKMTVSIGRETLLLCLSERWVKEMILEVANMLGLTISVENATQCVIMSMFALLIAYYTTVPFTKYLLKKAGDMLKL